MMRSFTGDSRCSRQLAAPSRIAEEASSGRAGSSVSRSRTISDTVSFNVGGRVFEVLPHIIRQHNATLLASLLDDIGTDRTVPIYVDANPDRFAYVLDWYRYHEMMVPREAVEAVLRDARYFLLPDTIKVNGEVRSVRKALAAEVNEVLRRTVLAKWPSFETYKQQLALELTRAAELLGERSDEVDTDMLEQPWDCSSDQASTHPSRHGSSLFLPQAKREALSISKEFTLAEVAKSDEIDSNLLEVQSMAPMFMHTDEAPPRWRWCDEGNVCNEIRLRVLKSELERMGLTCQVLNKYRHGVQKLSLKVEVSMAWSL